MRHDNMKLSQTNILQKHAENALIPEIRNFVDFREGEGFRLIDWMMRLSQRFEKQFKIELEA